MSRLTLRSPGPRRWTTGPQRDAARRLWAAILAIALILGAFPITAAQATGGGGTTIGCTAGVGDTAALIAAISAANTNGADDTLNLAAGCVYLITAVIDASAGPTGLPPVLADGGRRLTINGNGATLFRPADTPAARFFLAQSGARLTLNRLTLWGGDAGAAAGGAILNQGTLSLDRVNLRENRAQEGGALQNHGTASIVRSALFDNSAQQGGGAIRNSGGSLTIESSTLTQNSAQQGGAIFNGATLQLTNATVARNSAGGGGGIFGGGGNAAARNTVVASNSADNCSAALTDQGHNLQFPGSGCGAGIPSVDPLLGPFGDNGGPTPTITPLYGSPTHDAGNNATCAATDQRGFNRPVPAGSHCDIGAFEQGDIRVVTNTNNSGPGSLRQAVIDVLGYPNAGAPDAVHFSIPGAGPFVINLSSPLPTIHEATIIDAATQPGYGGAPLVELNGSGAGSSASGFTITRPGTVVRGLAIGGFAVAGVNLNGAAPQVIVQGNHIGTDAAGTGARPNGTGVLIQRSAAGHLIGGDRPGTGNLISGNSGDGVQIRNAHSHSLWGNRIGTSAAGSAALPNGGQGVSFVYTASRTGDTAVGGLLPGLGNLIAGNAGDGLRIGAGAKGNRAQGNTVGAAGLGNLGDGLRIHGSENIVGGPILPAANQIAFNGAAGAAIPGGERNSVRLNRIFANAGLGIDLGPTGVTPNDAGDGDGGANRLQNFPSIDAALEALSDSSVAGTLNGATGSFAIDLYAGDACDPSGNGEGQTYLATVSASGGVSFNQALPGVALAGKWITATATDSSGNTSEFAACAPVETNQFWTSALLLNLTPTANPSQTAAAVTQTIAHAYQERWYRFPAQPGGLVQVEVSGQPGIAVSLHRDPNGVYAALANPQSAASLAAGELPSGFLPSGFLPSGFLPSGFLPSGFLPSGFLPSGFLPSGFLPSGFLPSGFLPSGFLPSGFLPSGFLPSGFLPSGFLPEIYSGAVRDSLLAFAYDPQSNLLTIDRPTWDLGGELYIRVIGPANQPFTLNVRFTGAICAGLNSPPAELAIIAGDQPGNEERATAIVWDAARFAAANPGADLAALRAALNTFAARGEIAGAVIDLAATEGAGAQYPRVAFARAELAANPTCAAAANQLASEVKAVIDLYRDTNQGESGSSLRSIVLVGDDDSVPFFRYPDQAGLAGEREYVPPVAPRSVAEAALRDNRVLGQDAYGASAGIWRGSYELPLPDLPVGRLVGDDTTVIGMLDAYSAAGGTTTPDTALVTGYDFVADGAGEVVNELAEGLGSAPNTLIQPVGGLPTDPDAWTADELREVLFAQDHDLVFLTGHFSAGSALAADYATGLLSAEVPGAPTDFTNDVIFVLGCHGGYNIPGPAGIPGFSPEPDWAEAFNRRGATYVAATGYAYGDTELVEYGERFLLNMTRALRTGDGPVALGQAMVAAKQQYLADKPTLSGIDEKTLLQFTLYGLPMFQLDLPGDRIDPSAGGSIVGGTTAAGGPDAALGLRTSSSEVEIIPSLTRVDEPLINLDTNDPVQVTYFKGGSGVVANPVEPYLPLERRDVGAPGLILRGVGFRSGDYSDIGGITPLTGAPATEQSSGRGGFASDTFYPSQPWAANYFGESDQLQVAAAQYRSDGPLSQAGTLRTYQRMRFRLFYLDAGWTSDPDVRAAGVATAPEIDQVSTELLPGGRVGVRVFVVDEASVGVQQVWITYTDPANPGVWQSIDLDQDGGDPTLWATPAGGAIMPASAVFMVQAANAAGRVTLDTNDGAYYPATPPPPAGPTVATSLTAVSVPADGVYGAEVGFQLRLRDSNGANVANQMVRLSLGGQLAFATTDGNGVADFDVTMRQPPGDYRLRVIFGGAAGLGSTQLNGNFRIEQADTALSIAPVGPVVIAPGGNTGISAVLTSAGAPIADRSVLFMADGPGGGFGQVVKTNLEGRAVLGAVGWATGTYTVRAYFAGAWPLTSGTVTIEDTFYNSASAGPVTLIIGGAPTTTASVSGPQRPECPSDCYVGSATVTLTADQPDAVTRYSINGGPLTIYSGPFLVTTEGENTVSFFSTSAGGAVEATQTITVKITRALSAPLRDAFNRSNRKLDGFWAGQAVKDYRIVGNQVDVGAGGPITWNRPGNGFGADQIASFRLTGIDPDSRHHTLMLKADKIDWGKGVILVQYNAVDQRVEVEVRNTFNDTWETVASYPVVLQPGDTLGARALADGTVRVYVNCTLVGTADTTASGAGSFYAGRRGFIGVWFQDADDATFDDFSGGSVAP